MARIQTNKPTRRELLLKQKASHAGTLLEMLIELLPASSRTSVKQGLRDRCVRLRGEVSTQFDAQVEEGDLIEIFNIGAPLPIRHPLIKELYSDDYLMVLHKAPGIPTISVGGQSKTSLFQIVAKQLKEVDPSQKIFLLNRLDRDTEGVIVLARERQLQQDILSEWSSFVKSNTFEAVVLGDIVQSEGMLSEKEEPKQRKTGQKKETLRQRVSSKASFSTISSNPYLSHLKVSLLTRNNSIRSALTSMGFSILGDERAKDPLARSLSKHLALRATELTLFHPILHRARTFTIEQPVVDIRKIAQVQLTRRQKEEIEERKAPQEEKSSRTMTPRQEKRTNR